jgi:hypothetical protein
MTLPAMTRLRKAPARQVLPASPGCEGRQFVILSRDAVRRLLNAAVHSRDADPIQFAIWVATLAATPPTIYGIRMIFIYLGAPQAASFAVVEDAALGNRLFFLVYAMIASALLAALIWEALLPDRSDQEIVGVLPVRPRTVAAARLAAATSVAIAFALALSVPSGIFFSLASGSAYGLLAIPKIFVAHVVSIALACLLVFAALLILRGVLALIASPGAATSLATILQLVTIVALSGTIQWRHCCRPHGLRDCTGRSSGRAAGYSPLARDPPRSQRCRRQRSSSRSISFPRAFSAGVRSRHAHTKRAAA